MGEEVIVERIEGLKTLINERFDLNSTEHGELKKRADTTNGRVKRLEIWRAGLFGAWCVISVFLTAIVIPLAMNYLQTKQNVKQQVEEVMSKYEVINE